MLYVQREKTFLFSVNRPFSLAKASSPHLAPSKLFRLWALLPHKPTHITCPHDFIAHQAIELLPSSYYQHTSIALSPITPLLVSPCLLITMTDDRPAIVVPNLENDSSNWVTFHDRLTLALEGR